MVSGYDQSSSHFRSPSPRLNNDLNSSPNKNLNSIVVTVEGFNAPLLGAFGSNVARTPRLDRLAARGTVLDQCSVDATTRQLQLRSLWTGLHAMQSVPSPHPSIWQACNDASIKSCLITDSHQTGEFAESLGCDDAIVVELQPNREPAEDVTQCNMMQLFAVAAEILSERDGLVWIHSSGLHLPWDAPLQLRQQFKDPDDPDPPSAVEPPAFKITNDTDPDEVIGWGQVAAAQAAVFDEGLATLQATLAVREDASRWAWLVAAFGGVPLGEHGRVGWAKADESDTLLQFHAEELMSPVVLVPRRLNEDAGIGTDENAPNTDAFICSRRAELFQLPDLAVTLAGLLDLRLDSSTGDSPIWGHDILSLDACDSPVRWARPHQLACTASADTLWIRCPAWSATVPRVLGQRIKESPEENLTLDPTEMDEHTSLFVKPEDRWEVNNVSDRRIDILAELLHCGGEFLRAVETGQRDWSKLPEELTNLLR